MTVASQVKQNLSSQEQSERLKKLRERIRKKGLQPWVKSPKKESR